jgi:23S rRNA (cytidine1920-2'-O)/16S rRNA (cytidine1409-2'-O)-methyltransferase
VLVGGVVADKSARLVAPSEPLRVTGGSKRFVSRGGEKLDAALERFAVAVRDRQTLDAGASTGGFTDCLLQRGAASVVAVDVGHGQLDPRLRADPRVTVLERTDVRTLDEVAAGPPATIVVADLSFISLTAVAPVLCGRLAAPGADVVVLVKPQFEAGRIAASRGKGVIRDPAVRREALGRVASAFAACGGTIMGAMASPLLGPAGNAEYLLHIRTPTTDQGAVPGATLGMGVDDELDRAVGQSPDR